MKSQTKQVKKETKKIVSYTMVLIHNTAAVDMIHSTSSPNANNFVNFKLLHDFYWFELHKPIESQPCTICSLYTKVFTPPYGFYLEFDRSLADSSET